MRVLIALLARTGDCPVSGHGCTRPQLAAKLLPSWPGDPVGTATLRGVAAP
jgi:hypothetical protein